MKGPGLAAGGEESRSLGRPRGGPPIPLPAPPHGPGVTPTLAPPRLTRDGRLLPACRASWGDRCPSTPQAPPGHAPAPP